MNNNETVFALRHGPSGDRGGTLCYGSADMFEVLPYSRERLSGGNCIFVEFTPIRTEPAPDDIPSECRHREFIPGVLRIVSEELKRELSRFYFPGGFHVCIWDMQNGEWRVAFKAENILASCYMALPEKDALALLEKARAAKM